MVKGPRRVATGYDDRGNCIWASDGESQAYVGDEKSGVKVTDLWRISQVPVPMDEDGVSTEYAIMPPENGLVFRYAVIPPMGKTSGETRAGMHETETIDLMTMISGEIWSELEDNDKQIHLKAGDIFLQRGTNHAWYNRGDEPAVFSVTLVSSERTAKTPSTKMEGAAVHRRGEAPGAH